MAAGLVGLTITAVHALQTIRSRTEAGHQSAPVMLVRADRVVLFPASYLLRRTNHPRRWCGVLQRNEIPRSPGSIATSVIVRSEAASPGQSLPCGKVVMVTASKRVTLS